MTLVNGMSVDRLAMFADSVKDLTYKEMKSVSTKICNKRYDLDCRGEDFTMADILVSVADELLEELRYGNSHVG